MKLIVNGAEVEVYDRHAKTPLFDMGDRAWSAAKPNQLKGDPP